MTYQFELSNFILKAGWRLLQKMPPSLSKPTKNKGEEMRCKANPSRTSNTISNRIFFKKLKITTRITVTRQHLRSVAPADLRSRICDLRTPNLVLHMVAGFLVPNSPFHTRAPRSGYHLQLRIAHRPSFIPFSRSLVDVGLDPLHQYSQLQSSSHQLILAADL